MWVGGLYLSGHNGSGGTAIAESVGVVRVREADEDAVVGDADGGGGHGDRLVCEGNVTSDLQCCLHKFELDNALIFRH